MAQEGTAPEAGPARPSPLRIVILGGGTAGWITAALFAKAWAGSAITVIESPQIGIIGVGEGSTPQLKAFFDHIGVAEHDWMQACDATFKLGIRFDGWSRRPGFETYFHPFPGPTDLHSEPGFVANCTLARRGFDVAAHPDGFFLASVLADARLAPQPGPAFPFAPSYGYHFDAFKLGGFLRDHCTARGVTHRSGNVVSVERGEDGDITALATAEGERIEGDLFVDCSGFRSVIAQQSLGVRFIPFAENLFNDRAVVMPTPRDSATIEPATRSIAMQAGWRWSIPLTTRTGNGYVYSSAHISPDEAEAELRAAIGLSDNADVKARHLEMHVGRVAETWSANCLATGLAQGFIEPLEATALHIVIATALDFVRAWQGEGPLPQRREAFNARVADRYEGIRDYIVAHYRLNQLGHTDYWRANAANPNLSDALKAMFTAWYTHGNLAEANDAAWPERYYSNASWHCIFAGYGSFPPTDKIRALPQGAEATDVAIVTWMLNACARNFESYAPPGPAA